MDKIAMRITRIVLTQTALYLGALLIVLLAFSVFNILSQEEEDFLFLADIVKTATNGKIGQTEQVKALTAWLAANVTKTSQYPGWERSGYPEWFDGSSVASVIRGGIGNCGYQANNIIVLSRYLGIRQHQRYWIGQESGSAYEHAFAELIADGRPGVYDPNILIYQQNDDGVVLGLRDMLIEPDRVGHELFRKIVHEIQEKPHILRLTALPETPEPFGEDSYAAYIRYGAFPTRMYMHLRARPLSAVALSWLVYLGLLTLLAIMKIYRGNGSTSTEIA